MSETFGGGEYVYRAVEGWAKWPEDWTLHDVAAVGVDRRDNVYAVHRGDHPMVVFDRLPQRPAGGSQVQDARRDLRALTSDNPPKA